MALTVISKNRLGALLSLLTLKDGETAQALMSGASRLLTPTNRAHVLAIISADGQGGATPRAEQTAALAALVADVETN